MTINVSQNNEQNQGSSKIEGSEISNINSGQPKIVWIIILLLIMALIAAIGLSEKVQEILGIL